MQLSELDVVISDDGAPDEFVRAAEHVATKVILARTQEHAATTPGGLQ